MWILTWLIGPLGRYVIIAALVGGGWLWLRTHYIDIGYQKALHAIAAQDQKAVAASKIAKSTVADCFAKGNQWNVENGSCDSTP